MSFPEHQLEGILKFTMMEKKKMLHVVSSVKPSMSRAMEGGITIHRSKSTLLANHNIYLKSLFVGFYDCQE